MSKLCDFTLTPIEASSLGHCINYQYAIHKRTFNRVLKYPAGKATDNQVIDRHYEAMNLCMKLQNMLEKPIRSDEDYWYYEEYLGEEEEYLLIAKAIEHASKRLTPATIILAESALDKIAENFI